MRVEVANLYVQCSLASPHGLCKEDTGLLKKDGIEEERLVRSVRRATRPARRKVAADCVASCLLQWPGGLIQEKSLFLCFFFFLLLPYSSSPLRWVIGVVLVSFYACLPTSPTAYSLGSLPARREQRRMARDFY